MANRAIEKFLLSGEEFDVEMFLNNHNEIFVGPSDDNPYATWFTISKEDWDKMKEFIDRQFEE